VVVVLLVQIHSHPQATAQMVQILFSLASLQQVAAGLQHKAILVVLEQPQQVVQVQVQVQQGLHRQQVEQHLLQVRETLVETVRGKLLEQAVVVRVVQVATQQQTHLAMVVTV
jgi:hypothetical protein